MKLPVFLLAGSLVANAALLATAAPKPSFAPPLLRDLFSRGDASNPDFERTNLVVGRLEISNCLHCIADVAFKAYRTL